MLNRLRKTLLRPLAVLGVAAVAAGLGASAFAQAAGVISADALVDAYEAAGDWRAALAEIRAALGEEKRDAVRETGCDFFRAACRRQDGHDRRPGPGPLMAFVVRTLGGPEAVKEIHEEYGFGRRDLVALAVLVRLSGEDVAAVASLKTEENSWTDVASALDADEELVRLLLALLRHARHGGPAVADRAG